MSAARPVLPLLFPFVVGACASMPPLLAKRFAREQSCDVDDVRVSQKSSLEYTAEGCGKHTDYVCESAVGTSADASRCSERGSDRLGHPPEGKYRFRRDLEPPR